MVNAIASSVGNFIPGAAPSRTSLEGEVASCKKQMADWVTCVSAKTPEGQAKIKDISERMSAAQSRLDALPAAKSSTVAPVAQTQSSGRTVDVYT